MAYQVSMIKDFWDDLTNLPRSINPKALRTVDKMMENPWSPELHPEKINQADAGVHSCRVDQAYRLIWKYIKPDHIVFCMVDNHDEAYRRAARKRFTLEDGIVKVVDVDDGFSSPSPDLQKLFSGRHRAEKKQIGKLFIGYREKELLELGVPEDLLPRVRALDTVDELERMERLLPAKVFNELAAIALGIDSSPLSTDLPKAKTALQGTLDLDGGPLIVSDAELRKSLEKNQGGDDLYLFVNSEEFKKVLNGDIEGWMLFLAPHQRRLVTRQYGGPARIRGIAGSGKTVVAIHRVRHLAQQMGGHNSILFLTFGNRLPAVNQHLLKYLTGANAPELKAIECTTIHKWCYRFLSQNNHRPNVDRDKVQQALLAATNTGQRNFPQLGKLWRKPRKFFEDEIRYAIKGRGIDSLDEYLHLERSGRGTGLLETERRAVWSVYQQYQANLQEQNIHDFDDYVVKALRLVQNGSQFIPYQAAVVDEVQDLTEVTIRLVRAIVKPGPDDLLLVGDGLQRLYPGGFVLSRLGIDVTGRGTVLRRNYRNTQEILRAAFAVMEGTHFNDLDDQETDVEPPEYSVRRGPLPVLCKFTSPEEEIRWVGQTIRQLKQKNNYKDGDFVILYRMRQPYKPLIEQQLGHHFRLIELSQNPATYFGPNLKHTTFDSAKGLEFKVVFIVGVTDGKFVPREDRSLVGPELEDYYARERSRLFVAMSRARDQLFLSYSQGQPSRFLRNVPPHCLKRR